MSRLNVATFAVFGAEEAVALRAAAAYLNALRGRALVTLAQSYVKAHEEVVAGITAQVEAGAGAQADLVQAEGRLAIAQSTLVQYESTAADDAAAYREAVGDWPSEDLLIPSPSAEEIPPTGEDLVTEALLGHPSVLSANQNIRSLEFDARAARAVYSPLVTLRLNATRNENAGGTEVPTADVTAMFNLSYNFYRGGADKAAIETSNALLNESRLRLDATRRQIEQSAWIAFNAYHLAQSQLPQLEEAAEAGRQALEDYAGQFEMGDRTLLDRLTVEDQAFAAETGLVNGKIGLLLGHYQILASLGRLRGAF